MLAERSRLKHSLAVLPDSTRERLDVYSQLPRLIRRAPYGRGQAVLTLPGYSGNDESMLVMRYFLKETGYKTYSLDLGNHYAPPEDGVSDFDELIAYHSKMLALTEQRIETLYQKTGKAIALMGWDMAGSYALAASQKLPDKVKRVITLDSTFGCHGLYLEQPTIRLVDDGNQALNPRDPDGCFERPNITTRDIPINVIYSPRHGTAGEFLSRLPEHPCVTHTEVDERHVPLTFNTLTYRKVAQLLAE